MMVPYSFKPRLWPTLFTSLLLICLLSLGVWQMQRLEWKLGLIEQIESRAFMTPVSLPLNTSNLDDLEYLSVSVTGQFNNDHEMTLYSVGPNGEPGYDLYAPLFTSEGNHIIVNRGWVPEQIKFQELRPNTIVSGDVTVEGLLRKPTKKLWYGPANEPVNNNWYYRNLNEMAETQKLNNVFPMYLYASRKDGDLSFPVAGRTEINIVNNHLDYVMTWFGLAIVLIGIYVIVHTHRKEP